MDELRATVEENANLVYELIGNLQHNKVLSEAEAIVLIGSVRRLETSASERVSKMLEALSEIAYMEGDTETKRQRALAALDAAPLRSEAVP